MALQEFYACRSVGHAFMDFIQPSYHRQLDELSWPRTLELLNRHLSPGVH